jgi:ABC-type branched-subunit amino acid transport system ATPase component
MLSVANIQMRFGGLRVLSGVSFEMNGNGVLGLIGPNGAGKTTLFNILTGFLRPNQGQVMLAGRPITRLSPERRTQLGIARTFQVVRPFARLTVLDNVMIGAFARAARHDEARRRSIHALERVGLADQAERPASALTLPDRKRLELARCLATGPRLLLLDEMMCGLNPTEMDQIIALIRMLNEEGIAIILVEHIMDAITALAHDVIVLDGGEVLARGTPEAVLGDARVIEAYLGVQGEHAAH